MNDTFNYKFLFDQAIQRIKSVRDPHSTRPENFDLKWDDVRKNVIFDFGGSNFEKYTDVVDVSKKISISCLNAIIIQLLKQYNWSFEQIDIKLEKDNRSDIYFTIMDNQSNTLLFFKEIEECSYWKLKNKEPEDIQTLMQQHDASFCKYIYLVFDYAYLQIIGYNDDESDPGRGYNVYSIRWFFETYFGKDEYERFYTNLKNYIQEVSSCLGYIFVKSLTPNALINFRKVTENAIVKFPYELLLQKKAKDFVLKRVEFDNLKSQYLDNKTFLIMLGNHDFAESLITAEWLHDSMKKSCAIDLTVIGMGYFKAVEQLLFDLICLHKDDNRSIKKDYSRKDLPKDIPLNDDNIKAGAIDTTIGSMANFYKDNLDILRDNLSWQTKKYIRETIFTYKELRNGYFHKHNIHSWDKINEIREATFFIVFLLLGAHKLTDGNVDQLGIPDLNVVSDYFRLCEYVNYHKNELFFLNLGRDKEVMVFGCCDMHSKTISNNYIKYSGVYFREIGKEGRISLFSEEHLPKDIYMGKFVFSQTEGANAKPVKVKKIFENGKFVGPSIVDEDNFDY